MSLSPTSLLQRLQQLKVWQETHDALKSGETSKNNITTLSDYQTIEGLSAFDSPDKSRDDSKRISPAKPFQQLLEEKLAQDPGPGDNDDPKYSKRPFLRKGSGLERFKMKPGKPPRKLKINRNKKPRHEVEVLKEVVQDNSDLINTPLKVPEISMKPKATWVTVSQETTPIISEPSEQTLYEKALEKELMIFEALETRANNSSFCSTNSSVLRILSSTPSKINKENVPEVIQEEKRVHWGGSESEDCDEITQKQPNLHQLLLRLQSISEKHRNQQSNNNYSSNESLSTTISSADLESTVKQDSEADSDCSECENELKTKIEEYQSKIEDLSKKNCKIQEIEENLKREKRNFEMEMLKKRRDFDEERRSLLFELEEERKLLIKERTAFQANLKNAENRPNKKERVEISSLRQELADLKEISKMKESKNGMSQARLRNQLKQLEKDNFQLKEQIEKLTKENAKLSANQKVNRRNSETKMLQEISKNVTKLTRESSKIQKLPENSKIEEDNQKINQNPKEIVINESTNHNQKLDESNYRKSDKIETLLEDGSKEIKYSNGNVKVISSDGNSTIMKYFNGDLKKTNLFDGTVKYYYKKTDSWQTTFPDGSDIVDFNDGRKEKRFPDGNCEVLFPDGIRLLISNDGTQEINYPDGSNLIINCDGEKILKLPNGQKEIQAKDHTRREYPDGTVKILYPNGSQETRYSNGRVRIKDSSGKLLLDNQCS